VKGVKIIRPQVHGAYKIRGKLLFRITERRMLRETAGFVVVKKNHRRCKPKINFRKIQNRYD